MRKLLLFIFYMSATGWVEAQRGKDGYQLVWADEFNKEGAPDTANWKYEYGFVRNEELQWYQPENAACKNGLLSIEARKEVKPIPVTMRKVKAGGKIEKISVTLHPV